MSVHVGWLLKSYRRRNNLIQQQMATKIGVSREYYSRLERSIDQPSIDLLQKISSVTGHYLEQISVMNKCFKHDDEITTMCELCTLLHNNDRREIVRIMKCMLEKKVMA